MVITSIDANAVMVKFGVKKKKTKKKTINIRARRAGLNMTIQWK